MDGPDLIVEVVAFAALGFVLCMDVGDCRRGGEKAEEGVFKHYGFLVCGGREGRRGRVLYPRPRSARFRSRLRSQRSSSTRSRWIRSVCNFADLSANSLVILSLRLENSSVIP